MLTFPNAKINFGLFITEKRSDGFHNLETLFYPIPLKDGLEIIPSEKLELVVKGDMIMGSLDDNLVIRAWGILKKAAPELVQPVKIILYKHIPSGAGMGGGSSDAAFMLRMLNDYFKLELSTSSLCDYALQLGSDCPFFIYDQPMVGKGRGELLEPIDIKFNEFSLQVIFPDLHIPTPLAFENVIPTPITFNWTKLTITPVEEWKEFLYNDFEKTLFDQFTVLASVKKQLYAQGAVYASLSGSGSTVYGVFPKNKRASIEMDTRFKEFYFVDF